MSGLDSIKARVKELIALEKAYKTARTEIIDDIGIQVSANKNDSSVLSYIYWETDLPISVLSKATGITGNSMARAVPKKELVFKCKKCHEPIIVTVNSRNEREDRLKDKNKLTCDRCIEDAKVNKEKRRKEKDRKKQAELEEKIAFLRAMPYEEYLKTEHWQQFRKKALKHYHYQCQKCDATGVRLDVHHLTYERRGCELLEDVITLCKECHEKEHDRYECKHRTRFIAEYFKPNTRWRELVYKCAECGKVLGPYIPRIEKKERRKAYW